MEVKLHGVLGNYDRSYDRQTNRPTDRQTDRPGHREVSLPIKEPVLVKENQSHRKSPVNGYS